MPNITNIPAGRVPLIDPRTQLISREWYRFFVNLFNLTGAGTNEVSLEELQYAPASEPFPTSENDQFGNVTSLQESLVALIQQVNQQSQTLPIPQPFIPYDIIAPSDPQLGTVASKDYSIGNWTPVITASVSDPTVNYVSRYGNYIKIGNLVQCDTYVEWDSFTGGSGNIRVSLPFPITTVYSGGTLVSMSGLTFPTTRVFANIQGVASTSTVQISTMEAGTSGTILTVSGAASVGLIQFTMSYFS